jgi:CheY-like chemotaxis protein
MVYGFAKQSRDHVTIYSEVGHGTTVKLYVPRSVNSATRKENKEESPMTERDAARILVVEDNESVREISVSILTDQGYEVVEANDGNEALKFLNDGSSFDLLFTDVILPGGMNGADLADEAKRLHPGIKVLYTTGYVEHSVLHNGIVDQGVTIVNKPYRRAELLEKVRASLEAGTVPPAFPRTKG